MRITAHIRCWMVCAVMLFSNGIVAQTVLLDDFNRPDNTIVGNSWQEIETATPGSVNITSGNLKMSSSSAGRDYVAYDVSAYYNTVLNTNTSTLTWMFNMKQSRSDPSGFDNSNYGIAFVIGCSSNNFLTGNGYAVVLGNSGSTDNLRLVRFVNGLDLNSNLANVIAPVSDFGTEYLSVQVTYNPVGNLWSLFVESNTTGFTDPLTATYTQLGTATADGTYTGVDLLFTGCLWNHNTLVSDNGLFDNVRIPNQCNLSPEPTLQVSSAGTSNVFAGSSDLSWTNGNGSERIIIGRLGGAVTTVPVDGVTYVANTSFGSGTMMAPNEYVVYRGSGNSVTITGLLPSTFYEFRIFELDGSGCNSNYLSTNPAVTGVTTTPCVPDAEPTVPSTAPLIVSAFSNSLQLSWTRGDGDYCMVVCNAASPGTGTPSDGSTYTANSIFGTSSTISPGEYVVYIGTGNTLTVTGLLSNTTYYFTIFEFNGTGCNSNYLTGSSASVSGITSFVSSYNTFFGNLHAHSDYSDGDLDNVCNGPGSAYCCYNIGNTALNFDFMGIADHNHNEGPVMTKAKYASGLSEAALYNTNFNDFVALFGMEWGTISTGGHVGLYGIDSLVGWNAGNYDIYCAKGDYNTIFNLVASTPGAFASLCHPGNTDFGNILGTPYNSIYDNAIVSVAVRNGPYNSTNTTYSDAPGGNYVSFYKNMLAKGYHLGPVVDLDNHNSATMGKCSEGRTAVLASSLTPADIKDAILNMRFYATEDFNVNASFTVNSTYPMGSIITQTVNPTLAVAVSDPDGESVAQIKIWYGVPGSGALPTVLSFNANSSTLTFTHSFSTGTFYYFAEIEQADGNLIWTSPVWYNKTADPLPVALIQFSGNHIDEGNLLEWKTSSELNNDHFTVESSPNGYEFTDIGTVKGFGTTNIPHNYYWLDKDVPEGITYYKLRQTDYDGACEWSKTIAVKWSSSTVLFTVYPNPSDGKFSVMIPGTENVRVLVYNVTGQIVDQLILSGGDNAIDLQHLYAGIYLLSVVDNKEVFTPVKLIIY